MTSELSIKFQSSVDFYDTNLWIGENYLSKKLTVRDYLLSEILSKRQDKFKILGSLVTHFNSYFYYPKTGNDLLSVLISKMKNKDLHIDGAMVMEKDYFTDPASFKNGLISRYKQGFKCLRLFPKSHKYPFETIGFGKFYEVLNYYNFPIMVSLDEIDITGNKNIEWEKVLEIANKYKNIPIIIDGGSSKELMYNSYLFSLLQNSSNIYLNIHNMFAMNQIEDLVKIASSKRLVFDTYYPYYDTELSVGRLINATITRNDKKRIASLNIENIFKNISIK